MLESDADTALAAIFASVEALRDLLTCTDAKKLRESTFHGLGWLFVSLGEMGCQL